MNPAPTAVEPKKDGRRLGSSAGGRFSRHRVLGFVEAYALLFLLILFALFFTFYSKTSSTFPTSANLRILAASEVVPAIIALAALLPLVCNEFDLSVGAIAGIAAIYVASVLSHSVGVPLAVLVAIGFGIGIGTINALLVTKAGVNGVITTLGTSALIAGVVSQKTGGQSVVSNIPTSVTNYGTHNFAGVPLVFWTLIVIVACVYFLLEHTPFGRQAYAVGSNRNAAELVGLRTNVIVGATFVIGGTLCGLAGFIYVAGAGGADPSVGPGYTLSALTAAFLSAAAVRPGRFNVGGTVIALFFLAVLDNGLSLAGAQPYVSSYVTGLALIIGVSLAMFLSRRRAAAG